MSIFFKYGLWQKDKNLWTTEWSLKTTKTETNVRSVSNCKYLVCPSINVPFSVLGTIQTTEGQNALLAGAHDRLPPENNVSKNPAVSKI